MTLGERIVYYRKQAGYTQKALAEALEISPTRLNYWEKDKREPDVTMLNAICRVLGISGSVLLGRETAAEKNLTLGLSADALQVARDYASLDNYGQSAVKAIITEERRRVDDAAEEEAPKTKIIPLLGTSFAAGRGEPDTGNMWENYEVPADSPAQFAIHISGDSMEPYLRDGSIALGVNRNPDNGEVVAITVDGENRVKQFCRDAFGNVYLFSLNRARKDADETIWAEAERYVKPIGVILMDKKFPLPLN